MNPRPARRLVQLLTVAVSAYYALWACAPAATMRPLTLDLDQPNEFGLAASGTQRLGDESRACTNELFSCAGGFNGQLWYQHRFNERFSLGGTIFGGQTSFVGAGVLARLHWVELDRFRFGTDLEAGFLWGAVGFPVSVRLVDDLWIYTNPSVGARFIQAARLPLGLAWGVTEQVWIQGEFTWGFDFLNGPVVPFESDMWTGAVSGSVRF
ncbi:MAG: hypothetical protein Q8P18_09055 [Pseudomonadota bacterium]|nr:hypothetical protein [Pseudomonadota bacterium]